MGEGKGTNKIARGEKGAIHQLRNTTTCQTKIHCRILVGKLQQPGVSEKCKITSRCHQ